MKKILNTTTLTFLQVTTFIFYTIAFGWIRIILLEFHTFLLLLYVATSLRHESNVIYNVSGRIAAAGGQTQVPVSKASTSLQLLIEANLRTEPGQD